MAGFQMPNSDLSSGLNALAQGLQQGRVNQRQNRLAELVPAAFSGDQQARSQLMALDPSLAMQMTANDRAVAAEKRAVTAERKQEINDFLSREATGLAHLDDAQLSQVFPTKAQQWIQQYPELASQITPEFDQTVRPTIMGLAGIKPSAPSGPTDDMREFEYGQQNPAFMDYQIAQRRAGATNVNVPINTGQKGFDNELKIRGDFRSEPVYKAFQEMDSAYRQIGAGLDAKSPAGDLAAATKFMKLLDQTSVVRESELGMAMAATGALDRLSNYANRVYTGEKLTESQREDFRKLADEFYTNAEDQYLAKRDEYQDIARDFEMDPDRVTGPAPKGRNRAPVQVGGDDDWAQVPSGAEYTAPDGSVRVKR